MRIAIANDSRAAAEALRRVIAAAGHALAWTAHDGEDAVRLCVDDAPDLVLMDLNMPRLDGVEATREIMRRAPCAILIVTSDPQDNVGRVFRALGAGALDVTATPVLLGQPGGAGLLDKIRTIGKLIGKPVRAAAPAAAPASPLRHLVAIGASTGGPLALSAMLARWQAPADVAVVVVQHIDAAFADQLVQWLGNQLATPVRAAAHGAALCGGTVLVARTNDHLRLTRELQLRYDGEPRDMVYRPSIDVFFDSVARHWAGDATGILLTGMGRDGAAGLLALRDAGKQTIAQDEASCAVYGMPRAAAELCAAVQVMDPDGINAWLRATMPGPASLPVRSTPINSR
ncbi:MAG: chemotaxis-specific protein-glutamate methyltransferase CheB [Telluria sp.]